MVDDEILVREAIRDKIKWEELGFTLVGDCENGKEAIQFLQKQPVDVVLTDIYMPYIDGLSLSRHILEEHSEIAVIILSGHSDFEYAREALKYNVVEYILKPVTAKELSAVLTKMKGTLDEKHQEKERFSQLTETSRIYKRNENYILSKILSNLIKGSIDVATALRDLSDLDIQIKGECYRVAIIEIEDGERFDSEDEEKRKRDKASESYAITNIAGEIIGRNQLGTAFRDAENLINLLFYSEQVEDFNALVSQTCQQILFEVNRASEEIKLAIGIGTCVKTLEELHHSYHQACDGLSYLQLKKDDVIIDMEQILRSKKEHQTLLAIDYLYKNYSNCDLTLKDVCEHLGMSASYFSSIFKKDTGTTFLKYLNHIRMEKAMKLLRETDLRNYEIAEKVGFSDPHYFTIAFKKMTGETPQKYGRENQGDQ